MQSAYNMKINTKHTKIMCISRQGNHKVPISIDGQQIQHIYQFKYFVLFQQMATAGLRHNVGLHWVSKCL